MSERKLINKFIPRDFDPDAMPKVRRPKGQGNKIERSNIMLPLTCRCLKCKTIINVGKKFNGKKETLEKRFNGIPIVRIYFRCEICGDQITFCTDPQNLGYTLESGAERLSDVYLTSQLNRAAQREENENPTFESNLDQIEQRTMQSRQHALELDGLEEMYDEEMALARAGVAGTATIAGITTHPAASSPSSSSKADLDREDEEEFNRIRLQQAAADRAGSKPSGDYWSSIFSPADDDDDYDDDDDVSEETDESDDDDSDTTDEDSGEHSITQPAKKQRTRDNRDSEPILSENALVQLPQTQSSTVQQATTQSIGLDDYSESE